MNNAINYSGFVDMFLDSSDDFEPYGYSAPPSLIVNASDYNSVQLMLHLDKQFDEPWGE